MKRGGCDKTPKTGRRELGGIYSELDQHVKASCRPDKKTWIAEKEKEAHAAADRGDSRTLCRIVSELPRGRNRNRKQEQDRLNTWAPIKRTSGGLCLRSMMRRSKRQHWWYAVRKQGQQYYVSKKGKPVGSTESQRKCWRLKACW